ncbi:MAG: transcriptional regulator [Hymenobacteraceae bacterium]|nr:transcriptional regulator [Hymenobacteraceae bacterium]
MRKHNGMRPHDIVILLKILAKGEQSWYNKDLAEELYLSASEISESLNRSVQAGFIDQKKKKVFKNALLEFLVHGLKYVFPQQPGALVRGIPTAHSAPVAFNYFLSEESYVWPDSKGNMRGQAIEPLYPTVPQAAQNDAAFYNLVALCDMLRVGRVREIKFAADKLKQMFQNKSYEQTN